jgi:DNA invertase Pin-like site-specific DNA recombinase
MKSKHAPTKAVGYVRVSTTTQAEEGVSLDAQRAKVISYANLHNLDLVEVFADEGISGKRADNRPGLQAALEATCRHQGVLVVYSLSRLARSTRDAIEIVDRLEKCKADLALIDDRIDTISGMGRFVFRLMASLGELERDQVSERTIATMGHMRKQGRRISRHIPYGYELSADGHSLTKNQAEQRVVSKMKRWRLNGVGPAKLRGFKAIAEQLNADGVPTKTNKTWYASTVRSVLTSTELRKAKH